MQPLDLVLLVAVGVIAIGVVASVTAVYALIQRREKRFAMLLREHDEQKRRVRERFPKR